jgi:hypothetical protein
MNALTPDAQAIAKTMYPDRELFSLTTDEISEVRLAEQMLDAKKAGKIPTMPGEGPVPPSEIQETAIAANARAKAADIRLQRGAAKAPASPLLQTLTAKAAETPKTPSFDAMASFLKLQKAGVPIEKLKTMPASEVEAMLAEMEGKAGPGAVTTEQAAATPPTLRKVKTLPTQLNSEEQIAAQARDNAIGNKLRKGTRSKPSSDVGMAYPELMARLGLGATGAAVGSVVGAQQDPLGNKPMSALAGGITGGLAGAALPSLTSRLPEITTTLAKLGAKPASLMNLETKLTEPGGLSKTAKAIYDAMPNAQRFNYLMSPSGLIANTVVATHGSLTMAAIEGILSGDSRAFPLITELLSPAGMTRFIKEYHTAAPEAQKLIENAASGGVGRAEMGNLGGLGKAVQSGIEIPGLMMTTSDVVGRNILMRFGYSADEARTITLTSQPFTSTGHGYAGIRGWLASMLAPFRRTPTNVVEQGFLRTPGVGFMTQASGAPPANLRTQLVRQGMGIGVGVGSEQIGEHMSPENARLYRRYLTNYAGQYGLQAALGLTIGAAKQAGRPWQQGLVSGVSRALPLPTMDPVLEPFNFFANKGPVPRGWYPAGTVDTVKDIYKFLRPKPKSDYDRLFPKVK